MLDVEVVRRFLNQQVGVLHTDSGRDFYLKGILSDVTSKSVTISSPKHGVTVVSLDSLKKIKGGWLDD